MIKQKTVYTVIFIIILTSVFSQNTVNQLNDNGARHGLWTKNYHNTNQKRYEGKFVHGKEIDTFNYYKLSKGKSVLSAIKVFNANDSLANVTFLASNKKVISKGQMNGKRFIGQWVYYHKDSEVVMTIENYNAQGELDGERKVFYKNGNLAEFVFYKNGSLNGEGKWFTEKNKLIKIANFKENDFHGKYIIYDSLGKKTSEGVYVNGAKNGVWHYYEDGKDKTINHSEIKAPKKQ